MSETFLAMKKLLLSLCLLSQAGLAETPRIDSLKREVSRLDKLPNGYINDTLHYQALKALMRAYSDVDIDSSLHCNSLMIRLCKNSGLQKELSFAFQYAGYLYQVRGDYYRSAEFYLKSLSQAEESKQYTQVARAHGGLAHAYTSLEKYSIAKEHCDKGLEILRKHPDVTIQLAILNVLGAIYREQGQLADALRVNQDMYILAQREHKPWFESHGLHAIGWVYKDKGDLTKALGYYKKALALCRKIGSGDLEGSILLHIADVYILHKRWSKALVYSNQAKQRAMHIKNSGIVAEAYEKQYEIFRQTGESAKALRAYENFVSLKDSLSKDKNQQRIESLQAQYRSDSLEMRHSKSLAEKTLQLLTKDIKNQKLVWARDGLIMIVIAVLFITALLFWNNRQLQTKNRQIDQQRALLEAAREQLADINKTLEIKVEERTQALTKANRELVRTNEKIKEALFEGQTIERKRVAIELHDNLSSLLGAVNMSIQTINPQNLSEPEQSVYRNVKQLIQNAYAEVRNISHNILPARLEREGLATTLTAYIDQLNQTSRLRFSLTLVGLQERLPMVIESNVYAIVLELIHNTIKHAKATTVDISLLRTNSEINVLVIDNGIGLGQNQDKRGVGLQNIQSRLEPLDGTFNTVFPAETGTRIDIKIPIETVRINGNINIV